MGTTGITRKRWSPKEIKQAVKTGEVEGRTRQAVVCMLNKLGYHGKQKRPWTPDEIHLVQMGGKPVGRSDDAIYQIRHKLGIKGRINKHIDPKNPDQPTLFLPPGRKNPPKHHHESVGELLQPIYTMYNGGIDVQTIAKTIHQTVEFVESAIRMKTEFKPE